MGNDRRTLHRQRQISWLARTCFTSLLPQLGYRCCCFHHYAQTLNRAAEVLAIAFIELHGLGGGDALHFTKDGCGTHVRAYLSWLSQQHLIDDDDSGEVMSLLHCVMLSSKH